MAKKSGLGKGLDALIPGADTTGPEGGGQFVPISAIQPNPRQPRVSMQDDTLLDLANSIREHGILQPLIVTQDLDTQQYTLIAGERRLRAAKMAGLESVPVIVRNASEQQRLELALIENLQRADLSPLETAEAYRQLAEEFGLSHEEIAERVNKSRVAVTNTLRLLKLPESVRQALANEQISEGHARALLALSTPQAQNAVLQIVLNRSLSVRQTEELVRMYAGERPPREPKPEPPPEIRSLEERLREFFGTRVTLKHGKKGGSLIIHYYSDEELNSLIAQILKE
jgi:ParB family chromosome partitioning protein